MPKATLTFNLPEENEEYMTAVHAGDYRSALWELDQHLRSIVKYTDNPNSEIYQEIRDKLREFLGNAEL
jgi:hypothetical protein